MISESFNSSKHSQKRVALVFFNLGAPDKPGSIRSFLFNLFNDKAIIDLPFFIRYPLAHLISLRRSSRVAKEVYSVLGGRSPLLENTWKQALHVVAELKRRQAHRRVADQIGEAHSPHIQKDLSHNKAAGTGNARLGNTMNVEPGNTKPCPNSSEPGNAEPGNTMNAGPGNTKPCPNSSEPGNARLGNTMNAGPGNARPCPNNASENQSQGDSQERTENTEPIDNIEQPEYMPFVCMRYSMPRARDVITALTYYDPDEVVLVPLYPQFSTTTTGSSFKEWFRLFNKMSPHKSPKHFAICCYPQMTGFIEAVCAKLLPLINWAKKQHSQPLRILFSAHGLPKSIITKRGDPYQEQVEKTAANIADKLKLKASEWLLCYQSRVGYMPWLQPYLSDEITKAGKDGWGIIIVPIAFVSEHAETLVELDKECAHFAEQKLVPFFYRAPTVQVDKHFVKDLASSIEQIRARSCTQPNPTCSSSRRACPRRKNLSDSQCYTGSC